MIARLRTAAGNVPLFEQAGAAPGVPTGSLTHAVRPDLLAAAERAAAAGAGALPEPSAAHLRAVLVALARDAMPWCSPARRSGRASMRSPHTRSRPCARTRRSPTHARAGERIAVLRAAPSSERPTRALFERQARETLARMEVWVVPDAWARFRAGDAAGYRGYRARLARVADAA